MAAVKKETKAPEAVAAEKVESGKEAVEVRHEAVEVRHEAVEVRHEAAGAAEGPKTIRDILEENMPGPVTFTVPRNPQKPKYLLVSVNGVRYSMEQGKTVTVPWNVWKVLDDSMKADEAVAERIDRLTSNPFVQTIS